MLLFYLQILLLQMYMCMPCVRPESSRDMWLTYLTYCRGDNDGVSARWQPIWRTVFFHLVRLVASWEASYMWYVIPGSKLHVKKFSTKWTNNPCSNVEASKKIWNCWLDPSIRLAYQHRNCDRQICGYWPRRVLRQCPHAGDYNTDN